MRQTICGLMPLLIVSALLAPCTWANGPDDPEKCVEPTGTSRPSSLYAFNSRSVNAVNQDGLLDVTEGHFGHLAWVPCADCPGLVPKVYKSAKKAADRGGFAADGPRGSWFTLHPLCITIPVGISYKFCDPAGHTQAQNCSASASCTDNAGCSSGGDCTQGSDCSSGPVCTSGTNCSTGWDCTLANSGCSEGAQCTSGNNCSSGRDCTVGNECSSGNACTSAGECSTGSDCTVGTECSSGTECTGGPDCSEVEDCTEGTECSTGQQCTAGGQCSDHNDCTSEGQCTDGPNCSQGDECTSNSGCSAQSNSCTDATGCTSNFGCSSGSTQCGPAIGNPGLPAALRMARVGQALDGFGKENGVGDLSALLGLSVLGFGFAGAFVGRRRA